MDETKGQVSETIISDEQELDTLRAGVDDPFVLKEQLQKEAEARRQLTARARKAEQEAKQLRDASKTSTETINHESSQRSDTAPTATQIDAMVDLRLDGYSKQEAEFILANGGRKAIEDKNSYVSIAINTRREQERAEREANKTPDNSQLSEVERKFTPEQLKNMSSAELEKILPHTGN